MPACAWFMVRWWDRRPRRAYARDSRPRATRLDLRVAFGADLLSNSAATTADVRDPVGDDQSSWVLQPVPRDDEGMGVRHETSSPAIVGPREALDE